jgi:uncharacterized membrane protein YhaH (DUF805 family)
MESNNSNYAYIKSSKFRPPPDLQTPVLNDGHDVVLEQAPSIHILQHKSKFAWLFFSTSGRLGRLNYFLSCIAINVVGWTLNFVSDSIFFKLLFILNGSPEILFCKFAVLLLLLYSYIALSAKRMHDMDLSAHCLWLLLVPIVGLVMPFILQFMSGSKNSNRYGPPTVLQWIFRS